MLRRCVHGIAQRAAASGAATRSGVATPMLRTVMGAGERSMAEQPAFAFPKRMGKGAPPLDLEAVEAENKITYKKLISAVEGGNPGKQVDVDRYALPAARSSSQPPPPRTSLCYRTRAARATVARDKRTVLGSRPSLSTACSARAVKDVPHGDVARARRFLWDCHTMNDVKRAEKLLWAYSPIKSVMGLQTGAHFIKVRSPPRSNAHAPCCSRCARAPI